VGATMTQIHLPEDIGDTPAKAGAKPIAQSYSFVLAKDALVQYVGIFPPNSEEEEINPIYKPLSENVTDVFALGRQVKSSILFRNVSNYDIEPNQWGYQLSDTTGGTMPQGSESIIWTERINARASYPGSLTEVKFLPQVSAIQLRNYPVSASIGYQQTVLYSNRVFSAGNNPILVTVAVSMTLSDNPNCSKTWGLFGGNSGYFFRIYGTGQANNFKVGYRRTLGASTNEVEIPRSQFNGDKLDGTNGHSQTFTNVGMFGIEVGTAGIGARFWAYVEIGGSARWVLVHSLQNDSDNSQDRITDEEGLPISFEVKNVGQSTSLQTLSKYGTSVTSIGTPIGTTDINSISTSKPMFSLGRRPLPILGIRARDFINNKKNFINILGTRINVLVSTGLWRIVLIKNPTSDSTVTWTNLNSLSAIQYSLNRDLSITDGTQLCQFLVAGNKPLSLSLEDVFALNRSFLTAQYSQDAQATNDFGQSFFTKGDEIWVCGLDANAPFPVNNTEIIWDASSIIFAAATYENSNLNSISTLSTQVNVSLNILEV
jgi:hypothetical protein